MKSFTPGPLFTIITAPKEGVIVTLFSVRQFICQSACHTNLIQPTYFLEP